MVKKEVNKNLCIAKKSIDFLEEIEREVCALCRGDVKFLSTGITLLDLIMGGGLPLGQFVELFGQNNAGKTLLTMLFAKACQDAGGFAVVLDLERKFELAFAKKLGVNIDPEHPNGLKVYHPTIAEEAGEVYSRLIKAFKDYDYPILICWDSLSSVGTKEIGETEGKGSTKIGVDLLRGETARVGAMAKFYTSFFCHRQSFKNMRDTNIILVGTSQMRANIGVRYGEVEITPGGFAIKHAAVERILLKATFDLGKVRADGRATGNYMGYWLTLKVVKSQHSPPGRECIIPILFNSGADNILACLAYLQYNGGEKYYVNPGYFIWDNVKYRKGQLLAKAREDKLIADRIVECVKDHYLEAESYNID